MYEEKVKEYTKKNPKYAFGNLFSKINLFSSVQLLSHVQLFATP